MLDQLADRLAADYLAAEPDRGSSRTIVRALSAKHGLSEAKARGVLVKAGVYLAMPRDRSHVASADHAALTAYFARDDARGDLIKQAAEQFGYYEAAILKFRMASDLPVLSLREVSFRQSERSAGEAHRQIEADLPESPAEAELEMPATNPEPGFFSNPLWPAQLVLLLFLSTLVAVALKSIHLG